MKIPEYDSTKALEQRKEVYALCYSVESLNTSAENINKLKKLLLQLYPQHFTYGSSAKEEWHKAFEHLNSFKPNSLKEWFVKPILVNTTNSIVALLLAGISGYVIGQSLNVQHQYQGVTQQEKGRQIKINHTSPKEPPINNQNKSLNKPRNTDSAKAAAGS